MSEATSTTTSNDAPVRLRADVTTPYRMPFWKQATVVFLLACVGCAFLQLNPGWLTYEDQSEFYMVRNEGLPFGDGYYHIQYAYQMRTGAVQDAGADFHWTRGSIWNGSFSDKEWLYHLYLVPFTLGAQDEFHSQALINGAKLSAIVAGGILFLSLFSTMWLLGIKRPWFFVMLFFLTAGQMFLLRLTEPRSWVFGVSLSMLGYAIVTRRFRFWSFFIGAVYVLAYTASHLLPAMVVARMLFTVVFGAAKGETRLKSLRQDAIILGLVVLGMFVGWLIHPQSVELLRIWWVQNVLVLFVQQGGEVTGLVGSLSTWIMGWPEGATMPTLEQLDFGVELLPPMGTRILEAIPGIVFMPLALLGSAVWSRKRPSREAWIMLCFAMGFVLMNYRAMRFTEYSSTYLILAAGFWVNPLLDSRPWQRFIARFERFKITPQRFNKIAVGVLALGCVGILTSINWNRDYQPPSPMEDVGHWLQDQRGMSGKVIYHVSWSAFPELFFYRPDIDYISGMDPMFTAARADEGAALHIGIMHDDSDYTGGYGRDLPQKIYDTWGAEYIFVRKSSTPGAYRGFNQMAEQGYLEVAYRNPADKYTMYRIPPDDLKP